MTKRPVDKLLFDFSILRNFRKRKNWTIQDVCNKTGISPAVISKLERNQTSAELETIYRLSRAFDLSAQELIGLAETRLAQKIKAKKYCSNEFSFSKIQYGNIKSFYGFAPKGAETSKPEIHHNEYEVCWVLKGKLRLLINNEEHILLSGDAIQFDAILEHSYKALSDIELILSHLQKNQRF